MLQWPFNVRSFFTSDETRAIGRGVVLWRGYFQSVRPALGRLLINVDISTGAMYKRGPLIEVALEHIGAQDVRALAQAPQGTLNDRQRWMLQRFLAGLRVTVLQANGQRGRVPRTIKGVTNVSATHHMFTPRGGGAPRSVAQYFAQTNNRPLRYPNIICVVVRQRSM